ncbi:MAG: DUF1553 domain-containing protein [Akkermansiaceae bacterium]|nr:DUF1553 domain-containing protein [Akkermansiaceae bacterium]
MAARVDPSNRYLWRFHPRRLDAEQVRDALLAVSGELDVTQGGPAGDGNGLRRSIYTARSATVRTTCCAPSTCRLVCQHLGASEHHDADAGAATAEWRLGAPRGQARLAGERYRRCLAGGHGPSADEQRASHLRCLHPEADQSGQSSPLRLRH